jgi:hypothetical protein
VSRLESAFPDLNRARTTQDGAVSRWKAQHKPGKSGFSLETLGSPCWVRFPARRRGFLLEISVQAWTIRFFVGNSRASLSGLGFPGDSAVSRWKTQRKPGQPGYSRDGAVSRWRSQRKPGQPGFSLETPGFLCPARFPARGRGVSLEIPAQAWTARFFAGNFRLSLSSPVFRERARFLQRYASFSRDATIRTSSESDQDWPCQWRASHAGVPRSEEREGRIRAFSVGRRGQRVIP